MVIAAMELKDACSLKERKKEKKTYDQLRQHIKSRGLTDAIAFPLSCMDVRTGP